MHRQIKTSIGVLYVTVPAESRYNGIVFTVIYSILSIQSDGNKILFYYAPVAILISLLSVTASMLQRNK